MSTLRNDPLSDWSQRYIWQRCIADADLPLATKGALLIQSLFMDQDGQGCDMAYSRLAAMCRVHRDTARDHVKRARKGGWLNVKVGGGWRSAFGPTNRFNATTPPGVVDALRERMVHGLESELKREGYVIRARAINEMVGFQSGRGGSHHPPRGGSQHPPIVEVIVEGSKKEDHKRAGSKRGICGGAGGLTGGPECTPLPDPLSYWNGGVS